MMTAETRAKISASLLGHIESPETRAKIAAAHVGLAISPKARADISRALMGHSMSSETRMKLMGHPVSSETRMKISLASKGASGAHWAGGPSVWRRKCNAKRRVLGFVPMNDPFVGCEGHHLNQSDVIYIPKELHRSIPHNVWTGKNMERINALASNWMIEDWT